MSYQIFVRGDGENYWTAEETLRDAFNKFELECQQGRKVSLVWEDFDYEPE